MTSPHPSSLRILQVNATRINTIGGLETVAETLRDGLQRRGHVVTQAFLGDRFEQHTSALWEVHLAPPATRYKIPTLGSLLRISQSTARLFKLLWTVRPDVVHFNSVTWETAYFVALRPLFRYRLVVTAHGSDLLRPHWPVARAILPYVLRRATAVTTVSDALVTRATAIQKGRGPDPILILNGVNTTYWSPASTPPPHRRTIVSVGRLQHVKGHDVLVDAFAHVLKSVPDAKLILVGDGPERGALMEQATQLGIVTSINFAGSLEPAEIREHLRNARVFALPSRSEGLPVALLEALATGTPAVASAVGGVPNVLATGGGYTVPPEDPRTLADQLTVLLTDSKLATQVGKEAFQNAQNYSSDHVIDTYECVLKGQAIVRRERPTPPPLSHPRPLQTSRRSSPLDRATHTA
ncbi:MAG: hypothetical protein Rubg2KO_27360 [Rubricoccaceae bacterium]